MKCWYVICQIEKHNLFVFFFLIFHIKSKDQYTIDCVKKKSDAKSTNFGISTKNCIPILTSSSKFSD